MFVSIGPWPEGMYVLLLRLTGGHTGQVLVEHFSCQ